MEKYDTGETRVSAELPSRNSVSPPPPVALPPLDEFQEFIGQILDERFQITERLGKGGMSAVFKADHLLLDRKVAVKLLHRHLCSNASSIQRFHREAKAISTLDHENIVKVHAFGLTAAGHCYLVMDFLQAQSLSEILVEKGALPILEAMPIFRGICSGLAHTHERGIVHRDLKPANIMVSTNEVGAVVVKIVDYGIARIDAVGGSEGRLTEAGSTCGSPPYMSPEQCLGEPTDYRSDIYSLGCLFYEVLSGQRPFPGASSGEIMLKHLNDAPSRFDTVVPTLNIPSSMEAIIHRCLEKQQEARYSSVGELVDDLCQVGTGSEREDALNTTLTVAPLRQNRKLLLGLLFCISVLIGVSVLAIFLFLPQGKVFMLKGAVDMLFAQPRPNFLELEPKVFQLAEAYKASNDRLGALRALNKLAETGTRTLANDSSEYSSLLAKTADRVRQLGFEKPAADLSQRAIQALFAHMLVCRSQGSTQGEENCLLQSIKLCKSSGQPPSQIVQCQFTLCVLYTNEGRLAEAEEIAKTILETGGSAREKQYNLYYGYGQLGEIYLCQHNPQTALKFFMKAEKQVRSPNGVETPNHVAAVKRLAYCYTVLKEPEKSAETLKNIGL